MDATRSGDSGGEAMIRLEGVGKTYPDGTVAVHELDLDVARGEMVCLVGPSGCGKSTTLKMINRLIEPTTGRIWLDGQDVTDADPVELRRGIGYVIQQIGLFPHQRIEQNVMTVPLLYGESKSTARERAHELLSTVGLDPQQYARKYPHELSGGQRQQRQRRDRVKAGAEPEHPRLQPGVAAREQGEREREHDAEQQRCQRDPDVLDEGVGDLTAAVLDVLPAEPLVDEPAVAARLGVRGGQ